MKNNATIFVFAFNLAILVLLAILFPHLMISPGEPIAAHAELATDCFACHTPLIGSQPEKCIVCHKVDEIGIKTSKGLPIAKEKKSVAFHQRLIEEECVSCHSDHKGVQAFRPISQFSHKLVESILLKQCDSCHGNPADALHLKLKDNCNQCHTQQTWSPAAFEHKKHFRFDRDHITDCVTCHINDDYTNYTCYGCHEHSRSKIREEHVEEGIYDYEKCEDCHRSGDEDEAKWAWRSRSFDARQPRSLKNSRHQSRKYRYRRDHDDDHDDDDDD